jgi:hypothetical protein
MRKLLECLEDAEKQRVKSEDIEGKELVEGCYETAKRIVKQIAEDFRYFTNKLNVLLDVLET